MQVLSSSSMVMVLPMFPVMLVDTMLDAQMKEQSQQESMLLNGPGGASQFGDAPPADGAPQAPPTN